MKTLEEILQIYCGCEGPAFDGETDDFTDAGAEAYKKLEQFIYDIDTLVDSQGINPSILLDELDEITNM